MKLRYWLILIAGLGLWGWPAPAASGGVLESAAARQTPIWIATGTAVAAPVPPTVTPAPPAPEPLAALLVLHAPGFGAGSWAVVEWQDPAGGWHAVEGWRGALEAAWPGAAWAVLPPEFGQGPFRWRVMAAAAPSSACVSNSFWLPATAGERLDIWVTGETPCTTDLR